MHFSPRPSETILGWPSRDPRAARAQQHGVDRLDTAQIVEDFVAIILMDRLDGRAGGNGERAQAVHHDPAKRAGPVAECDHR
jgi:hypothetical protein